MSTVWKFVLPIADFTRIPMPEDARILSVQAQGDEVCLWALVNPADRMIPRGFCVRGTGHLVGPVGDFLGTVQTHDGALVWHVFEAS